VHRAAYGLGHARHVGHGEVLAREARVGGRARAVEGQGEQRHVEAGPPPVAREQHRSVQARAAHGESVQGHDRGAPALGLVAPELHVHEVVRGHRGGPGVVGPVGAREAQRERGAAVELAAHALVHGPQREIARREGEVARGLGLELGREQRLGRGAQGRERVVVGHQRRVHHDLHAREQGGVEAGAEPGERLGEQVLLGEAGRGEIRDREHAGHGRPRG
jgi:hypothetical protein